VRERVDDAAQGKAAPRDEERLNDEDREPAGADDRVEVV